MTERDVRLIAMYLPQYHPIPENDLWWGEGFTEWTNVRKARPRFPGHEQPHVPTSLGYYDLRDPNIRNVQAELASRYGIYGFCYYYYWFHGKQLLELPLTEMIASGDPRFPFCICWANENWTRRWDGEDDEILMQQTYSEEDDRHFIMNLTTAMQDDRYIRVYGKPLLLLYKSGHLPDAARTTRTWREVARGKGIGELYLVRVDSSRYSSEINPENEGFDAAMEFTPYWERLEKKLQNLNEAGLNSYPIPDDLCVFDYQKCMRNMIRKPRPAYKFFRGVFPRWDNTPRRKDRPHIFINSSPSAYGLWLSYLVQDTVENLAGEERLVFVNAWNEWGEGCHLEPEEKYGLQYLEATRMALELPDEIQTHKDDLLLHTNYLMMEYQQQKKGLETELEKIRIEMTQEKQRLYQMEQELESRQHRIRELINSWSWKLTAPLRFLHSRINGSKKS